MRHRSSHPNVPEPKAATRNSEGANGARETISHDCRVKCRGMQGYAVLKDKSAPLSLLFFMI